MDQSKTPHLVKGAAQSAWNLNVHLRYLNQGVVGDSKHKKPMFVRDGKDWFGCHLPEPVTGNLTDQKLCGYWSPVALKKIETVKMCTSNQCDK